MKFDEMLNLLNENTKKQFGADYDEDITSNLYRLNYAICKALQAIEEERQILEIKNNDVYLVEGEAQDRLYAQDFVFRKAESKAKGYWITKDSTPGTMIQVNELKLELGDVTFTNIERVTIDSTGYAKILMECEIFGEKGNIKSGQLTNVKTPILGINTGVNEEDFEGGASRENDYEFRKRYLRFRGTYAGLTKDDIQKELYKVAGVEAVQLEENDTDEDKVLDNGLVMPLKSFVAYVKGGSDVDVAKALYKKENTSISLLGDINVDIWSDTRKVYETINFYRSKATKIYFRYTTIGDVDKAETDKIITDYLMGSDIGSIISSYLAETQVKNNTDTSKLINLEVEFSKDNKTFSSVLRLLTGEKIEEVEKHVQANNL